MNDEFFQPSSAVVRSFRLPSSLLLPKFLVGVPNNARVPYFILHTSQFTLLMTPKSGLFLMSSCVAAIAAVGSIFELSSGNPQLGTWVTGIILAASVPLTGLFFYAAVRDARANQ